MKKLILAAAVTAAMFAGQASATAVPLNANNSVDFTTLYSGVTTLNEIWISGSSAATPFIDKAVVNNANGTVYKYADAGKKAFTYVAEVKSTLNGVDHTGQWMVVHKRDSGGSITAIKSAQGTLTGFNDPTWLSSNVSTCGAVSATSGIATCTASATITLTNHAASANISDVDAGQFESALNGGVVNASQVTSAAIATQTFGFAVNLKLRNALQVAQVAAGKLDAAFCTTERVIGTTTGTADDREDEVCMPNLTSQDLTSIFGANKFTDWGNLRFGGLTGQNLYTAQATADRPLNRDVHICSRTAGSGTLATVNIKFENAPCFAGNEAIQSPGSLTIVNEAGASGTQKLYHATTSSGELESCLSALDSAATVSTFTLPTMTPSTGFRWAIGILGTERNADLTLPYRFIKIDGASPSAKNVAEGKYKFWGELVTVGSVSTDDLTKDILANVSSATQISTVNVTNGNFGVTGYLGTANNASFAPTFNTAINGLMSAAFDPARPVNPFTHDVAGGGSTNHCRAPSIPTGSRALPGLN